MKLKDIHPYENNPRKNDDAVESVANSIRDFGMNQPIVVDKDNVIIVGHTRYKALQKLGYKETEVIVADHLTEEQVRAYRIADNSTNELSTWDLDLLIPELEGIDLDMSDYGLDLGMIDDFEDKNTTIVEDEIPDVDMDNVITKVGQVYRLGEHRLMCGDSTKQEDVQILMDGNLADMVFTDPPWNVNYGADDNDGHYRQRTIINDNMDTEDFKEFMGMAFESIKSAIKGGDCVCRHVRTGVGEHDA